jgi:hypothetical protein
MGVMTMEFAYDGKVFVSAGAAETAAADGTVPAGHYHQSGDLVWAEFSGGKVRHGSLAGVSDHDGVLRFAYCQVLADGTVVSGDCVSRPQRLPDGRIRLHEEWTRHSPRGESGASVVDEVAAATALEEVRS